MDLAALVIFADSVRYEQLASRRQAELEHLGRSLKAHNRRRRKAERLRRRAARAALRAGKPVHAADAAQSLAN